MPEVSAPEQLPVAQARAGEPAAWDALFRRYQLPLYVFVFELVREEQATLDLVQETFIAAVRHLGSLRDDDRFGAGCSESPIKNASSAGASAPKCCWRKCRNFRTRSGTARTKFSSGANRRLR